MAAIGGVVLAVDRLPGWAALRRVGSMPSGWGWPRFSSHETPDDAASGQRIAS